MKKYLSLALALLLAIPLVSCSPTAPAYTAPRESKFPPAEPHTSAPPSTPTPKPTPKPAATPTPEPTPTPTVSIPDSVTYTGSGDGVITIEPPEDIYVFTISGNQNERHFAVKGYDADGNSTELFVNTTDAYYGTTIDPSLSTSMLEITASGDWEVEVEPLLAMDIISSGDTLSGTGDAIITVQGSVTLATITGNADERHFAVKSYGYDSDNLMVNTTDEYSGTVLMKGRPFVLAVTAEGDWSITLD